MNLRKLMVVFGCAASVLMSAILAVAGIPAKAQAISPDFTSDFPLESCKFKDKGDNPFFSLKQGDQLYFAGEEDGAAITLLITVLNEKEPINGVKTRVVEERESEDGELVEVSRNYFAHCEQTGSVYYFGEDVDIYEDGEIVGHEGAWRAGENGATPGLIMPGTFLLGSRYYQEVAPGVALDRAEHVQMGLSIQTPAGTFNDCVEIHETTDLNPNELSVKRYCPGIGLVFDNGVELVNFGKNIMDRDSDADEDGE